MPFADRDQHRAYQRQWVAERRAQWFAGKRCLWCGDTEGLQLHHADPNRKVSHAIWSWGEARRLNEIAKCIVLCDGCHRRAHAQARRVEAELRSPHGTTRRYWIGCRCAPCKAAKAEYEFDRKRKERAA